MKRSLVGLRTGHGRDARVTTLLPVGTFSDVFGNRTALNHARSFRKDALNTAARRYSVGLFFLTVALLAGGCQPLAPGKIDRVRVDSDAPRLGNVYLLRGWQDLYSQGIDELARKLEASGMRATVFHSDQWRDVAAAIAARYSKADERQPLVLIGFSYGADDILRVAEELEPLHLKIDLAITIDPVTPPDVPSNVAECVNYYEPNGVWDVFPWLRGIPLERGSPNAQLLNQNIRKERSDLLEPDTSHATIAGNAKVHREIVQRVINACPSRDDFLNDDRPITAGALLPAIGPR